MNEIFKAFRYQDLQKSIKTFHVFFRILRCFSNILQEIKEMTMSTRVSCQPQNVESVKSLNIDAISNIETITSERRHDVKIILNLIEQRWMLTSDFTLNVGDVMPDGSMVRECIADQQTMRHYVAWLHYELKRAQVSLVGEEGWVPGDDDAYHWHYPDNGESAGPEMRAAAVLDLVGYRHGDPAKP